MPIIKSAKKRVKLAAKAKSRNDKTRAQMRDNLKAFKRALEQGKTEAITKAQHEAIRAIDIAAKYNVIHRNKAARKKSQLAKLAKSIVQPSSPSSKAVKATKKAAKAKTTAKKV